MVDVLVLGETLSDALDPITGELLRVGQDLGNEVGVILVNTPPDHVINKVVALGADVVYLIKDQIPQESSTDLAVFVLEQVCKEESPSVVLAGVTQTGMEVAPRTAARLGVGAAQGCIRVWTDTDTGRVVARRPVYGGNAIATVTFPEMDPQVIMLKKASYEPLESDEKRTGNIVKITPQLDASVAVKNVETVVEKTNSIRLEDADVVICGGRGIGDAAHFDKLRDLADLLGGAVGASRAACDAGWIDHTYQIGLTGKTVAPNLYIAIGVSGASQHMAGCSGSRHIVSINSDPEAGVFAESTYGVVGEWNVVLTSFIETVRELIGD